MAQERQHMGAGATGDRVSFGDAIPMKKTGVTTYAAIGVGVLAIGGIIAVTVGGSDKEAEKKAAAIAAESNKSEGPTLTAKQQQEHLKTTALAFERAKEAAEAKKAAEAERKAAVEAAQAAAAPAPAPAGAAHADSPQAAPAPKPKSPATQKAAKKQMDSLDSIGSDIASALK